MARFQDVSVGTKVIAVMICIGFATLGFGLFSTLELTSVNTNAADVRDNWLPNTRVLGELRYIAMRYRAAQATLLLAATDAQRTKQSARNADYVKKIEAIIADTSSAVRNDQERALIANIAAGWTAYVPTSEVAEDMNKSQGREAAATYYMGPMRASFDNFNKAIEAAIVYNKDGGVAAGNASEKTYTSARLWIFASVALAILFCAASGMVLVRAVSAPLGRITKAMEELSHGRLDVEVPHADQRDEIGQLAGVMTAFKNQLKAAERSKAEQTELIVSSIGAGLARLAQGDLTHRVSANLTGPFATLKEDFNTAIGHLQNTVKKIFENTTDISTGASEISQAADDLSRRTEQQAASLEETAAALEEIAETLKKTAGNTRDADKASVAATAVAKEGGAVVEAATVAMDSISQSSKQITDIIGVIDEIAFQTNLLALNAGVEAARAGDAGRGFAVVASEVRALAGRSSEAAKQIKALINTSGAHVEGGVKLVGESGQALRRIVEQVQRINALVSEVAGAADQQASAIQEVNAAVGQMDQVTQQNAAMVEQSTAASRSLADKTHALQDLIRFFDVGGTPAAAPRRDMARPAAKAREASLSRPMARRQSAAVAVKEVPQNDWAEF
ncbi:MAG: methyl-accepting chemotaxis protein [Rhizomicrobium sp.]|nr:methyl-accepting chemotaxis protein [Rhizomicrobium sp.]